MSSDGPDHEAPRPDASSLLSSADAWLVALTAAFGALKGLVELGERLGLHLPIRAEAVGAAANRNAALMIPIQLQMVASQIQDMFHAFVGVSPEDMCPRCGHVLTHHSGGPVGEATRTCMACGWPATDELVA